MDFDCKQEMGKAKRLALAKLTDILDNSGGSLDSDELNDMHHALEALQLIRDLECAETAPAPAPEPPPASGGTGGNGNGGASHPAADLTGIMAGMERLLSMVAQLVTAVTHQGGGGNGTGNGNGGSSPALPGGGAGTGTGAGAGAGAGGTPDAGAATPAPAAAR